MSSGDPQVPASSSDSTNDPALDANAAGTENSSQASTPAASVESPTAESPAAESPSAESNSPTPARPAAPIARGAGPLAARGLGVAKPSSPAMTAARQKDLQKGAKGEGSTKGAEGKGKSERKSGGAGKPMGTTAGPFRPHGTPSGVAADTPAAEAAPQATDDEAAVAAKPSAPAGVRPRVAVPNLRQPLAEDLLAELEAELSTTDVGALLSGPAGLENRVNLEEGQRVRGKVLKTDAESVFVALGGPDEGVISMLQFEAESVPEPGSFVDVVVRGFNREDGLYNLVVPGQALDVSDWEDLEEGTVVEAHVASANTGGLEATVGNLRGFIPISQIAEYRVEDASEFVGQRFLCVVTECNPRRKNLVLSRRAVLERERQEAREKQLELIEPGMTMEGTVRSIKDFGAFVDLGGLDGMIHISKLSWDNVKTPSDVLEVGQKVKVKIEKVDKQTGKISLSYRDLLDNPWDSAEASFPVGTVTKGTVSRLANFGAFVRLAAGVEGLVHISEIASHRVSNVSSLLNEGDEVQVKVLSIERESQRIALSIKQAQTKASTADENKEEEVEEPVREPAVRRQGSGPLKGGVGGDSGGNQFGLRW